MRGSAGRAAGGGHNPGFRSVAQGADGCPCMQPLYINGKFVGQATTGVQRVARCVVQALDHLLASATAPATARPCVLLCPPGFAAPTLRHVEVRRVGFAGLPLAVWEQLVLPIAARDGLLMNLAGAAPAMTSRRHLCVMHDAAVFDHPAAYSSLFVRWYRWLFRRLARRAGVLVTVSAFARRQLALHLGVATGRISVMTEGADHLSAAPADDSILQRLGIATQPYFLAVASANPTKNLERLLAAHAALAASGRPKLVLVGEPNDRVFAPESFSTAAATDTESNPAATIPDVVFAGRVSDAELVALYRHARALIFPSLYEGFGLPAVEAMSLGCPVVVSNAASLPEVCGNAALYVEPTSVASITQAMRRIADDAGLRTDLSRAGRTQAAGYQWSRSAAQLLALLPGLEAAT